MNLVKGLRCFTNSPKNPREKLKCGALQCSIVNEHQNGVVDAGKIITLTLGLQQERGFVTATSVQRPGSGLGFKHIDVDETRILGKSMFGRFGLQYCFGGRVLGPKQCSMAISRNFGQSIKNEPNLDRNFLVKLWVADKELKILRERRRRRFDKDRILGEYIAERVFSGSSAKEEKSDLADALQKVFRRLSAKEGKSDFGDVLQKLFRHSSAKEEKSDYDPPKPALEQPPPSQPTTGFLQPASLEEARVAPLLARSNLLITRDIEWANLVLGFEQENRYLVVDVCHPKSPVGSIREQSNVLARQLLRSRRPFVAYITDAMGNELFRVRRPFWWINSSIYAEVDGKEVGVVHRRWHLWKRIYDLYLGNQQFAVVENPGFWNWTFTLKDIDGEVLAQIDRDWRGFGFEIFTDAGQYAIRFGNVDGSSTIGPAGLIEELEVNRPLTLAERAVTVALAISLDNDYFSRHGGWHIPFVSLED